MYFLLLSLLIEVSHNSKIWEILADFSEKNCTNRREEPCDRKLYVADNILCVMEWKKIEFENEGMLWTEMRN